MMHHKDTIRVKLLRLQEKNFSVSLVFDNLLTVNCRSTLGIFLINVLATSCTKYKNILGQNDYFNSYFPLNGPSGKNILVYHQCLNAILHF